MKRIYIRLISYFDKREEEKPAAPMPENNDSCEFEASIERRVKTPVYTVFLASQGGEYLSHNDPPSAVPVGEDCANASSHESTIPDESMADEWEEIAAADVDMTKENLPPVMLDTVHPMRQRLVARRYEQMDPEVQEEERKDCLLRAATQHDEVTTDHDAQQLD